jgi:hypothetical protein
MPSKCQRMSGFFFAVAFVIFLSASANAIPNPIARVGTTSRSVVQKIGDSVKDVAVDVAVGAKEVGSSVVNRLRNI